MKILYPFIGKTIGGSHLFDLEIAESLGKSDFEPIALLHCPDGPFADVVSKRLGSRNIATLEANIPESMKDALQHPLRLLSLILRAARFLKTNDIDLIHCSDGPIRYIWFYAAKFAQVPFVLFQHTPVINKNLEKRLAYRFVDFIIYNSETTRNSLPSSAKHVCKDLCYPVSTSMRLLNRSHARSLCLALTEEPADSNCVIVCFPSNIHSRKRPEIFIKMACILTEKYKGPVKYLMTGTISNDLGYCIDELIKNSNLKDRIFLTGFSKDNLTLMAGSDVVVAPAVNEAFGRVLVEAMLQGTPAVASDDGGHKEIIEHGKSGFLVEPDNPAAFAEAVMCLLSDKLLYKKTSENGKKRVEEKFLSFDHATFFHDLYRSLLKG